jgi:hypothetical protein
MRATLPSSSKLAKSSVVPTITQKKKKNSVVVVRGGTTTIVKSSAFARFSSFFKREEEEERSSSSSSIHRKRCTHEDESTTLDRAIRASQSMVCQSIGGFNFGAFFCNDDDDYLGVADAEHQQQQQRRKDEEKKGRGVLNERLVWSEEDGYERQMRLATASFLAATTVAVGQPALALDFVVVDPSGAFLVIARFRNINIFSYPGKDMFRFFLRARVFSLARAHRCICKYTHVVLILN